VASLLERLGHRPDARVAVLCCDGLGASHAVNVGVYTALRLGWATSASLMVPSPWARDAAARRVADDIGVMITMNAPHDRLRWGPITQAPTLLDGDGGFPRTVTDLWEHADVDEVARECRAQVERAKLWGVPATHLGSMLGALTMRPEFFDVLLELAAELRLPLRLPPPFREKTLQFPLRRLCDEAGVLHVDHVVDVPSGDRSALLQAVGGLGEGVSELRIAPALDTPELRAYDKDWRHRVDDLAHVTDDAEVRDAFSGVTLIDYATIRDVQRDG
jgi:predicted glycoside hydrolase/deacetylase ChbG (UPF0249 family)